jgi:hypothetical protein
VQSMLTLTESAWPFLARGPPTGRGAWSAAARRPRLWYDAGLLARVWCPARLGEGSQAIIADTLDRAGADALARSGPVGVAALTRQP